MLTIKREVLTFNKDANTKAKKNLLKKVNVSFHMGLSIRTPYYLFRPHFPVLSWANV